MDQSISVLEVNENPEHIVFKIFMDSLPIGKITIQEEHSIGSEGTPMDDGEHITAQLKFYFFKKIKEEILNEAIKKVLSHIRNRIETNYLIFEAIKIKPQTIELKNAAISIGFEENGNEELILHREMPSKVSIRKSIKPQEIQNKPDNIKQHRSQRYGNQKLKPVETTIASAKTQIEILQYLTKNQSTISLSQANISSSTGTGIMTIRSLMLEFKNAGLVTITKRGAAYDVHPIHEKIRERLAKIGAIEQ